MQPTEAAQMKGIKFHESVSAASYMKANFKFTKVMKLNVWIHFIDVLKGTMFANIESWLKARAQPS